MKSKYIKHGVVIIVCLFCFSCYGVAMQERSPITWIDPDREQQSVSSKLADTITPALLQNKCQRIAILPFFDLNKRVTQLGRAVSLDLQSALANKSQITVVERDLLGKTIMNELTINRSGLFDEASIAKLGRFYGADTLITGWVYDTGNSFKITIQVLNVERARVLNTAQEFMSRNDFRVNQSRHYIW